MNEHNIKNRFRSLLEILFVSTRLGLTSFGGPVAHLGYFHEEYVRRRNWLDEKTYADLVALCQFLPGPASSQVGIGIGVYRAGLLGGILAFVGFTLPSVVALVILALIFQGMDIGDTGWIHGLKLVAVAVVAHAIIGMAQNLIPDLKRKSIALFSLVCILLWQTTLTQVVVIALSGIIGYLIFKNHNLTNLSLGRFPLSRRFGLVCLSLFFGLLILLPIMNKFISSDWLTMFDSFYRSGSLVFGGGHVVLPLLEREFVPTGWLDKQAFLAGYGVTQAMPGPLFTFAAYIGAIINGWQGGMIATAGIFLPAFLLILGTLPFWDTLRSNNQIRGAIMGVNAGVIGILIAAFYDPIWTSSISAPEDFALASILFSLLAYWKLPPWVIVGIGALGGSIMARLC
jgi:chromate transporter